MRKPNSTCCIFNYAPHYRSSIYHEMATQLSCDFYFGHRVEGNIKKLEYDRLPGFVKEVKNINLGFKHFKWQTSVIYLPFKKKYKYFILTGDTSYLSTLIILLFCRILHKKTFLWMHGLYQKPSLKEKALLYPFYKSASHLLLYGNYAKKLFLQEGFPEEKISVIYNSLDYYDQVAHRNHVGISSVYTDIFGNSNPVLLYIGRIQKIKKVNLLVEALAILKSNGQCYNLCIVGNETEHTGILDLVQSNELSEDVHLFGSCYEEEINAELIYNAHLCVSPGNIGLTAIHAMTYGTPCITHSDFSAQMPEFEIIEEGSTGSFFERDNVSDLAEKILEWTKNHPMRDPIRTKCYKKVDDFYNPDYQVRLLKNLLN